MQKITKVSRIVRMLILLVGILHVVGFAVTAMYSNSDSAEQQIFSKQDDSTYWVEAKTDTNATSLDQDLLSEGFKSWVILGVADLLMYLLIYYFVYRLFSQYAQGLIFSDGSINCIKNVGRCFLLWVVVDIGYPIVVVLIHRFGGFSQTLNMHVSLNSNNLVHLMLGLVIFVVAWVMAEAKKLHQEQALVI